MRRATLAILLAGLVVTLTSACQARQVDQVKAPVGSAVAVVEESWSLDPPNQRLILEHNGERIELQRLAPDSEACKQIVWSEDGSRVGFLLTGDRLLVFKAETGAKVADLALLGHAERDEKGWWPQRIRLEEGGSQVVFELCPEDGSEPCREQRL